jgi:hypothetical protein
MQALQLGFVYLNAGPQARSLYATGRSWFPSVLANTVPNCLRLGAYVIENSQQPSYPWQLLIIIDCPLLLSIITGPVRLL